MTEEVQKSHGKQKTCPHSGKGYWERTDILSDAIYEVFAPTEAVAMTPEEWERKESPVVDYVKECEVIYG